jgi:hypothetical protein
VGIDALFAFNILYGNDMSYPNLKCVWKWRLCIVVQDCY